MPEYELGAIFSDEEVHSNQLAENFKLRALLFSHFARVSHETDSAYVTPPTLRWEDAGEDVDGNKQWKAVCFSVIETRS